ncbi:MAG: sulfatase-like hydrolase/transferase [Phycisphaerales bacterium]|nr:MAG: sulfatase-like hydrolase/transferase [Phycisphaerales bacterium]
MAQAVLWLYGLLAPRAYSVLVILALICTLVVKLFHSWRTGLLNEYLGWVLADVSFLLGVEVILALVCAYWGGRLVIRVATVVGAAICGWSLMNAACLIRTGAQILPSVLLPLVRDPLNILRIIGTNMLQMPVAAGLLVGPSLIGLVFCACVLAHPRPPGYNRRVLAVRVFVCVVLVLAAAGARPAMARRGSAGLDLVGMRHNCQLWALMSFLWGGDEGSAPQGREVPAFDEVELARSADAVNYNVVVLVLEGVQWGRTSLGDPESGRTPRLAAIAAEGVDFVNFRSSLPHTTKALFAILTGRFPSASHDIAEAVPLARPYASLATILKREAGYRTVFFQSAKGDFEGRPGLVHNLGFEEFWARDDLVDPDSFIGYLGADEFAMLPRVANWIGGARNPFFMIILCSVTHDPYVVPEWFGEDAGGPLERYEQAIAYTDRFIGAVYGKLREMGVVDKTIFVVVGDHGEGFGEHRLHGHARISFDEVLHVPFCIRAPVIPGGPRRVAGAVSSIDVAPTLLSVLGFDVRGGDFDGVDALGPIPGERRVYFADWMQEGPAGYVQANLKVVYSPSARAVCMYDLAADPGELSALGVEPERRDAVRREISRWRSGTVFTVGRARTGSELLFGGWLCRWADRTAWASYRRADRN